MSMRHWQREHQSLLLWFSLLIVVVFSAIVIVQGAAAPAPHPMDQGFLISADLRLHRVDGHWVFQYPHLQWSGAISSTGVVGIYKLLINPSPEFLNWHIKLTVMFVWFFSILYLIRSLIVDQVVGALVLLGIGALGLQFLEPTSELLGAIFFNVFLLLIFRQRFLLAGIALALFGLAKVDMSAASTLVLIYCTWRYQRSEYMPLLSAYVFTMVLLLAPALYLHGSDGALGGRALAVFQYHYDYFSGIQSTGIRTPFAEAFNSPSSFAQAVLSNPREYATFIGKSIIESARNLFFVGHIYVIGFLVMFLFAGRFWRERGTRQNELNAAADITFILFISTTLFSIVFAYLHVRYAIRFTDLSAIGFAAMLEQTLAQPKKYAGPLNPTDRGLTALRITLGVLALGGLLRLPEFVAAPHDW
ncbi:hypothetical protein [uncultured Thiodictyon sp.]|uniref:hypothetical protein n=1 Tax=uncultured Thiodictyon sp. TaxID=1846217 RepID=UPI0025E8CDC6|nr:hypothetical protein [uncultured Thiodictyon sp.]